MKLLEDKCKHRKICLKKLNELVNRKDEEIEQLKFYSGYEIVIDTL